METIKVVLPANAPVKNVIEAIEIMVNHQTQYSCSVDYLGSDDTGNVYKISSNDGPGAFYYSGVVAAALIEKYNPDIKENHEGYPQVESDRNSCVSPTAHQDNTP